MLYRDIPSLKEYVVLDSTGNVHAEKWHKKEDGFWILNEFKSMDKIVPIESLQVELEMSDVYRGVYQ